MRHQRGFVMGASLYVIIGLTIALGVVAWYFDGKLDKANVKITELGVALGKEETSRKQHEDAALKCSASVKEFRMAAGKTKTDYEKLKVESDKYSKTVAEYINELLTRQSPAGLDECAATRKEQENEIDRRAARRK